MPRWAVTTINWRRCAPSRTLWHDLALTVEESDVLAEIAEGCDLAALGLRLTRDSVELADVLASVWVKWLALNEEGERLALGWPRGFVHR